MSAFYSIYGGIFFCRNVSGSTLSHGNGYDHLLQTDVGRVRRQKRFQILSNVGLTEKRSKRIHPDTGYVIILPSGRSSDYAYDRGKQRGQTFLRMITDRGYLYL